MCEEILAAESVGEQRRRATRHYCAMRENALYLFAPTEIPIGALRNRGRDHRYATSGIRSPCGVIDGDGGRSSTKRGKCAATTGFASSVSHWEEDEPPNRAAANTPSSSRFDWAPIVSLLPALQQRCVRVLAARVLPAFLDDDAGHALIAELLGHRPPTEFGLPPSLARPSADPVAAGPGGGSGGYDVEDDADVEPPLVPTELLTAAHDQYSGARREVCVCVERVLRPMERPSDERLVSFPSRLLPSSSLTRPVTHESLASSLLRFDD